MLFFDTVVGFKLREKGKSGLEKLAEREITRSLVIGRGGFEERPCLAEVVVLEGGWVSGERS